ncbi:MAG TPA: CAP domain-containing protein, partial [Capillimicrobium sp.]
MSIRTLRAAGLAVALLLVCSSPALASPRHDRVERALLDELDRARAAHGLPALRPDAGLARAADRHSLSMARHGRLVHAPASRLRRIAGARTSVGETLAYRSAAAGLARWTVSA